MQKLLITLFVCLSFFSLQATTDKLIVGTNAEFPPFTFIENGQIVGFEIDIAKAIALKLGKEIQWKDMPFDALIPDVVMEKVDFVAAGMSYTDERAKRVNFSQSYLSEDSLVIFSNDSSLKTLDDLKDKNVVVVEGFTADLFMSKKEGIHLVRLPNQADAFMSIKSKRADAFVTANTTVKTFLEKHPNEQFFAYPIPDTAETCAIVVPKGQSNMLSDINHALDEMLTDGTVTNLKKKWKIE